MFEWIKNIFRKKEQLFEVEISSDNDRIWVNGEQGCIFRLQGLSRTHFTIQHERMMDIRINAVVTETIEEDLIDEL